MLYLGVCLASGYYKKKKKKKKKKEKGPRRLLSIGRSPKASGNALYPDLVRGHDHDDQLALGRGLFAVPTGGAANWAYAVSPRSCSLRSSIFKPAAATFSSRWATLEVPGMGSMTGDRASNQARATWAGLAFMRAATRLTGPSAPVTRPAASGNQGIKPMSLFRNIPEHPPIRDRDAVAILHANDGNDGSRVRIWRTLTPIGRYV